jgi:hypothetical protein
MATAMGAPLLPICAGAEVDLSVVLHPTTPMLAMTSTGKVDPIRIEEKLLVITMSPDSQWLSPLIKNVNPVRAL